jgi:serine protease
MKKCNLLNFLLALLFILPCSFLSAQQLDHVLDEALVQLKEGTDLGAFKQRISRVNGLPTKARILRKISKQLNIYQIGFDHAVINEFDFRNHLSRQDEVLIVQQNHILTDRQTVPNDPLIGQQWQWINPNDADIDADLAWDITTGGLTANGDEIVVAVFDDGGDLNHPDLIANNWINLHEIPGNGMDDDNNGYVDDVYGWNFSSNNNNVDGGSHGVNVAGMIGAVGNNANQGVGANWNVKIMNTVRNFNTTEANVIEFYSYALDQRERYNNSNGAEGAFVVATNSSWGIDFGDPEDAPLWCGFYDTMGEEGILSCGATSNLDINVDVQGDLPTACPSEFMVAVTATNDQDNRTFSGYGATTIDVGAPGASVYTTEAGGGYDFVTGTSFASPATAGVIALLYSAPCSNLASLAMANPQAAAEQVRDALFAGAENVGNLAGDVVYGRINAFNSLQIIMENCGPCPAPAAINVSDVLDVSVTLNWLNPSDAQSNNLRYRATGAADWIDVAPVTMPYSLTGLTACTEYEVQIEAMCTDTVSGYSESYFFTTEGCCDTPEDLTITNITNTTASASWTAIFAAQSYNIRWSEAGLALWTEVNVSSADYAFTNLNPCTVYEVQVQTVCASQTTDYSASVLLTTLGCGACTDLTYCAAGGEIFNEEWISQFILGDINNLTPDEPASGYSDFTGAGITTTLETFNSYAVSMTPFYPGQSFPEYFKVYIDYNQDGNFNEADELAFDAGETTEGTITGMITLPGTALEGLTRLRLIMRWNAAPESCGEYNYGETEDYCVTIVAGEPSCDIPGGLNTTNITETGATFNWNATILAESYSVDYRIAGAATWSNVTSVATNATVSGLINCTNYEWRVASICPNNEVSEFSSVVEFVTICACAIPSSLDTANVTTTSADFIWASTANAINYNVRYKLQTAAVWTTQTVSTANFSASGLQICSDYEYQVRSVCDNNISSWSPSFDFTTACISSISEVNNGLGDLVVFPNPFQREVSTRFELKESTAITMTVYSATGQRIAEQTLELGAGQHSILVPGLTEVSQGLYLISLTTDKGTKVRRVVKN